MVDLAARLALALEYSRRAEPIPGHLVLMNANRETSLRHPAHIVTWPTPDGIGMTCVPETTIMPTDTTSRILLRSNTGIDVIDNTVYAMPGDDVTVSPETRRTPAAPAAEPAASSGVALLDPGCGPTYQCANIFEWNADRGLVCGACPCGWRTQAVPPQRIEHAEAAMLAHVRAMLAWVALAGGRERLGGTPPPEAVPASDDEPDWLDRGSTCAHVCGADPDHACDAQATTHLDYTLPTGGIRRMPICGPCHTSETAALEVAVPGPSSNAETALGECRHLHGPHPGHACTGVATATVYFPVNAVDVPVCQSCSDALNDPPARPGSAGHAPAADWPPALVRQFTGFLRRTAQAEPGTAIAFGPIGLTSTEDTDE